MSGTTDLSPVEYYRLCDEASRLGIPTSLDDHRSPRTLAGLLSAVETAKTVVRLRDEALAEVEAIR